MTRCASSRTWWSALLVASLAATAVSAQSDDKKQPAALAPPEGKVVQLGPTREVKLADYTWFRFGFQVQAWFKAAQDRIAQPDGSDGGYALDFYCRRCRIFATGSVVKDVTFNILLEAANLGKGNADGSKNFVAPSVLDAYVQVKFSDAFYLSGGSILLPLTRNGTQPTTTYLSIDNANVDTSPILTGNSNVIRDLGFQANGFFLNDHLEYRLGVFQGTRSPAKTVGAATVQTASHNAPRFVGMLSYNFWDTEKGYVNGGHYYGAKKVVGVMLNADYQALRTLDPPAANVSKDPYYGLSLATFINYPMSGAGDPKNGGDELVGLLQAGYYDGGTKLPPDPSANPGSYPQVLRQFNFLAEGAYYNKASKVSVFGKFEMRKINAMFSDPVKAANNIWWIATGLKYYVAPANLMNFALQYERVQFPDALTGQQNGTHNLTFQMQTLLY